MGPTVKITPIKYAPAVLLPVLNVKCFVETKLWIKLARASIREIIRWSFLTLVGVGVGAAVPVSMARTCRRLRLIMVAHCLDVDALPPIVRIQSVVGRIDVAFAHFTSFTPAPAAHNPRSCHTTCTAISF